MFFLISVVTFFSIFRNQLCQSVVVTVFTWVATPRGRSVVVICWGVVTPWPHKYVVVVVSESLVFSPSTGTDVFSRSSTVAAARSTNQVMTHVFVHVL